MRWISHMAIASAVTIPINPAALPAALIGSIAPDWIEFILKPLGIRVKHRGATHYILIPLFIILLSLFIDYDNYLYWFGIGYFTHWFADSLTVSGVPLTPWSMHKVTLFGGSFKTGDSVEYILSFSLFLASMFIAQPALEEFFPDKKVPMIFNKYDMNYDKLYQEKIIDQKTAKDNRFVFF
jgi:inner membrane protein